MNQSILFLGNDLIKLGEGEELVRFSVVKYMRIVHHLCYLLIIHSLSQLSGHVLHFFKVNESCVVGVV